jgi:hypothetical protein
MLYQQTLFIVAAFLTMSVHSLPSPPPDMGLKVIRQYEAEGGNITWYKDQKRSSDIVDLNRRQCGEGNVTCSTQQKYMANQSDCDGLISVLKGRPTNGTVRRDMSSVCYFKDSHQCCISVTTPIPNVVDEDYLPAAITLNDCWDANSKVAGVISYTAIKLECNTACLSNGYNDCTWMILK